jgi:predicted ATPase
MIRLVEALHYRCLLDVRRELGPFHVLVGPNASGKSTFLDVIAFLRDLLAHGVEKAVSDRSPSLLDLVWMRKTKRFDLAVELEIPVDRKARLPQDAYDRARYEVAIGFDAKGQLAIVGEVLWLKPPAALRKPEQRTLFPALPDLREFIVPPEGRHTPLGWKKVVTKKPESGNDYFFAETTGWNNPFRLGPQRLALANLPEDEERFPVGTWVKRFLMEGVQRLVLNSEAMRRAARPGSPLDFQPDGSNLPWAIEGLRQTDAKRLSRWIAHVRTALPDLKAIDTVEREDDRHRYLRLEYTSGLKAPSWAVSDGTLRLLALTLVAYLDGPPRVYLIEEPENGIHPQAIETVFQSLSSSYGSQILCASHSPVVLSLAEPAQVLCFARTPEGATDVVSGSEHPNLRGWQRAADLGTLFATGVLG